MQLNKDEEDQNVSINPENLNYSPEQINKNYQQIQIKDLLKSVGENGRLQIRILIFFCFCTMCVATVSFAFPFIYFEPKFYCHSKTPGNNFLCLQEEACKNIYGYSLDDSVRSVTYEYHLVCENKIKITRAQNVVLFTSGFGFYAFSFLSDLIGRKPVFFIAFGIMVLGALIVILQQKFEIMVLGHLIIYFGKYAYISVLYLSLIHI